MFEALKNGVDSDFKIEKIMEICREISISNVGFKSTLKARKVVLVLALLLVLVLVLVLVPGELIEQVLGSYGACCLCLDV